MCKARLTAGGVTRTEAFTVKIDPRIARDGVTVADLAEQDDVGILAQNRAQCARKRQLDLFVDLRLVDARDLVFDGILDRNDVRLLGLHGAQRGTERRRFAAPGGANDQDHPVLVFEKLADLFERVRRHADLFERRNPLPVIQHAHDDFLAVERAQRRDAEVDFVAIV